MSQQKCSAGASPPEHQSKSLIREVFPGSPKYRKHSKRKARNEIRLKAIRLGVPLDVVKPLHNPPMPTKTDWTFRERLLVQFRKD